MNVIYCPVKFRLTQSNECASKSFLEYWQFSWSALTMTGKGNLESFTQLHLFYSSWLLLTLILSSDLFVPLSPLPFSLPRECAVKFNDYFEFPRDMDMEPFTELGLAKLQGMFTHQVKEPLWILVTWKSFTSLLSVFEKNRFFWFGFQTHSLMPDTMEDSHLP